jgi:quinol monooxygenase YgiN
MATIGVIATLTIAAGKEAEFEVLMAELAEKVRANESGCAFYAGFRCKDNPQQYKVLEHYHDQAAFDAHGASAHFKAAGPKLGPCLAAPPHLEFLDGV